MAVCMSQRGFLTLQPCGDIAASVCTSCGRPTCAMHLSAQSGFTQCVSCTAADPTVDDTGGDDYDGVWSSRYRDRYYRESGYTGTHDSSYDATDAESFEGDPNAQDWTEGDEGGGEGSGFGES